MKLRSAILVVSTLVVSWLVTDLAAQAGQNPEELARRHYELGVGFMQSRKYSEALKDFQSVVDSYPTSAVAGDALVEIARYHLDVARDPAPAQTATDIILKKYALTSAAAAAYVLNGRIAISRGRTPADVDTALASFDRVAGLFPGSDAIPSAIYYAGEALRTVRRHDEALARYRDVTLKYPGSIWAGRALLGSAFCLTQTGRPVAAMEGLQRVRTVFAGSPEAAVALSWNTILYRFYIRAPGQSAYLYSGRVLGGATAKFKDVAAVAVDAHDNILLAHKTAVAVFDAKGALVRSLNADGPSAVSLGANGEPVIVRENTLIPEGGQRISLIGRESDGKVKPVEEIPGAVSTDNGNWLIANRKSKSIQLFSATGKYVKAFASVAVDRLAMNQLHDVAALDRESKTVALFDAEGKPGPRIAAKGTGYELGEPVDVAFDALGHLYVLDKSKGTVFVFGPQAKLVTAFSVSEKNPGSFLRPIAFGVDSAARLYIFDDRSQHVQLYQ
jgi:TolA-binding protein